MHLFVVVLFGGTQNKNLTLVYKYKRPPVIWGLDSVHGANYLYNTITTPQPINLAATFNVSILKLTYILLIIGSQLTKYIKDHCFVCSWKVGRCGYSTSWNILVV